LAPPPLRLRAYHTSSCSGPLSSLPSLKSPKELIPQFPQFLHQAPTMPSTRHGASSLLVFPPLLRPSHFSLKRVRLPERLLFPPPFSPCPGPSRLLPRRGPSISKFAPCRYLLPEARRLVWEKFDCLPSDARLPFFDVSRLMSARSPSAKKFPVQEDFLALK